jgi:hypothetical protein
MNLPSIPLPATVVFDIWGQRAETVFTADSELDPLTWMQTCYDKGFMYPGQVLGDNGAVLLDRPEILKRLQEL